MKSKYSLIIFSISLLLCYINIALCQSWISQDSGTSSSLYSVDFIDNNEGWISGGNGSQGLILHTTTGGTTWESQTINTTFNLFDVDFVDASNGWVVGETGAIFHTSNGGQTWQSQTSPYDGILFATSFVSQSLGWISADAGNILKTDNGGTTWQTLSSGTTVGLRDIHFTDTQNGWVVGEFGTIRHTSDGGTTWTAQTNPLSGTQTFFGVDFISTQKGWIAGQATSPSQNGIILNTSNGGTTWQTQTSPTTNTLHKIRFVNETEGWIVGKSGTILHTQDGGDNWATQNSGTTSDLNGIVYGGGTSLWGVGNNGTILKFTDSSLPVVLSVFSAVVSQKHITLHWRTESETNNLGFRVYRSTNKDGKFEKVAFVDGHGSTPLPHDYTFTDKNVKGGETYYYLLEDIDIAGRTERSEIISITYLPQLLPPKVIPTRFALLQNYPNPFNPETWIPYQLSSSAEVTINIYDVRGRLIRHLNLGQKPAGLYMNRENAAYWNGRSDTGELVSSGLYFYQLQAGDYSATKRMAILK